MQGDTDAESSMHVADFKWFIESLVKVDLGADAGVGISSGGGTVGGGGGGGSILVVLVLLLLVVMIWTLEC